MIATLIKEYRATMDRDVVHSWASDVVNQLKTVEVEPEVLGWCLIKAESVLDMTFDDLKRLENWTASQQSSLWDNMSLQEILNVYRVSAAWDDWEDWYDEEPNRAKMAWNEAVINPDNKMDIDG
jgi:hypothetical protein